MRGGGGGAGAARLFGRGAAALARFSLLVPQPQDPGWPLVPTGVVPNASALCSALLSLPSALRVYTHRLPCRLARTGLLPLIAPSFNRGYPLEAYLVRAIRRGPFATRNATHATAFLLPLRPYALRVAAFPGDGLAAVQARVASTEAWLDADGGKSGAAWRRNAGCDHILVSTHDKGGRVAAGAHALQSRGILVASTADTVPSSAAEEGRYTAGKDVAGICSFSLALPKWAAWRGACPSVPQPRGAPPRLSRTHALAFVGGSLGHVRSALFSHFAQHPWPDFAPVHGHVSPSGYMTSLLTSKFCLHVRGTQVQSPRLIEAILFGCVPVIMADTYDLPLSDVLDWPSFSIRVPQGSPEMLRPAVEAADYESLSKKVCSVAPFFAYHASPRPGDAFHMTMMEVFLRLKAPRPGCNGVPLLSPPPFLPIDNATAAPPLQPRRLLAT